MDDGWFICDKCMHTHMKESPCLTKKQFLEALYFSCYWVNFHPYLHMGADSKEKKMCLDIRKKKFVDYFTGSI